MKHIKSLTVIIPAYNEAQRISKTISKLFYFLDNEKIKDGLDYEIIVVDDGSRDDTRDVVKKHIKKNKHLRLNQKRRNFGKGYSVREGMLVSKKKYVLFMDADSSTSIDELKYFDKYAATYPVVIGIRTKKSIKVKQPITRVIAGRTFRFIARQILGITTKDTQCGFKLFNRTIIKNIFTKTRVDGFAFDVEVLYLAKKYNYLVREIPVNWLNDDRSTVNIIKDGYRMFKEILRIKRIHG